MEKLNIVYKKVEELIPYENNPRINDEAVDYVANSIKEFGFKVPIVIDKDGVVVAGHTRLKASKKIGLKEVPCIIADDLNEDQVRAFRLADNKVSEKAEWDLNKLELEKLDIDIDLTKFGFDIEEQFKEDEKEKENKKYLEQMEIKAFEHHDYIVFVFDNQMDWLNICNQFGLKKVDAGYGKIKKVAVGRVFDGRKLIEKIGYKDSNIE